MYIVILLIGLLVDSAYAQKIRPRVDGPDTFPGQVWLDADNLSMDYHFRDLRIGLLDSGALRIWEKPIGTMHIGDEGFTLCSDNGVVYDKGDGESYNVGVPAVTQINGTGTWPISFAKHTSVGLLITERWMFDVKTQALKLVVTLKNASKAVVGDIKYVRSYHGWPGNSVDVIEQTAVKTKAVLTADSYLAVADAPEPKGLSLTALSAVQHVSWVTYLSDWWYDGVYNCGESNVLSTAGYYVGRLRYTVGALQPRQAVVLEFVYRGF